MSSGAELNCEAVAQAEVEQQLGTVALQSSLGSPLTGRHLPLVGKILYRDVERLVAWITEQSSRRMSPGLRELLENIKPVLKTDERPEEASTSAALLEQVGLSPAFVMGRGIPLALVWDSRFTSATLVCVSKFLNPINFL